MSLPAAVPAPVSHRAAVPTRFVPALDRPIARRVLGEAFLLGLTADLLLRDSMTGLALPVWIAIVGATLLSLTWAAGRGMPRQAADWLAVAVLLAATVAWRDAGLLQLAGLLATVGALLMAAITVYDERSALRAERLRDTAWAAITRVLTIARGWLPLALHEAVAPGEGSAATRRIAPAARAVAIAAVLLAVFGSLLRGADPLFASLVALPGIDVGTMVSHVVVTLFFAWLAAGWTRAALDGRTPSAVPAAPFSLTLSRLEITTALGALNALFALFVLTQLGWFFGGERFLRERTGLTAAQYARQGFFQVVMVVLLVVPLLLATRAMLARDDRALARRHTALSLPLLALLGAIIASAMSRMQLYVHYFGLTTDRVYPLAFMSWLALVLGWMAWTVLRGRGERFVAGALVSGLAVLLVLDVASPDALVARVNIARTASAGVGEQAAALDLPYLASLGGDAVPLAVPLVLGTPRAAGDAPARTELDDARCAAADRLLERWGPESRRAVKARENGSWRSWNAGDAAALRAVADHARELRAVAHTVCRPGYPASSRRVRS